jgi:enamine deaminase RidA (YjgF/YER057c/UK114 family)
MQESMRRIGPGLRLAGASVAILAATASTANAAVATVNPFGCAFFGGGQATRPAGSTIEIGKLPSGGLVEIEAIATR